MKKSASLFLTLLVSIFILSISSCREKTTGEKIEDGVEEVGEEIKEGAEEVGDEIDDATDDN